ncbi:unnamed protein product, partial [Prorocentrum cordatum]
PCSFPGCEKVSLDRERFCRPHTSSIKAAWEDAKRQGPKSLGEFQELRKKGGDKWIAYLKSYIAACT